MGNVFLISDFHFNHDGICRFTNDTTGQKLRPWDSATEMDEALIDNFNKVVKTGDKTYVLGDVSINKKGIALVGRLNGRKILIRGNHDIFELKDYTPYFKDVRGSHKLDFTILTHIPIHPLCLPRWCDGNIHGHCHNDIIPDPRYFNVCVEHIGFTPIAFEDVKQRLKENQ